MKLLVILWVILFALTPASAQSGDNRLVIAVGKDDYIGSGPRMNVGKYPLNANLFESLTDFDEQFRLRPCLADSWEYKGNRTWAFHLRKDVKFHDGTPLTSAIVRQSFEYQAQSHTLLFEFVRMDDSSEHTLEITTPEENLILPYILSHPYLGIVKPDKHPVGTGAFSFVRYERDQFLEVRKNDRYWGEPAKTEGIMFRFIPDSSARMMSFLAQEVDVLADIPWEAVSSLKDNPQIRLHVSPPGTYVGLMISPTGALNDKNIRKAISMGLDRKAIQNAVWQGYGDIRQTLLAPSMLGEHAAVIGDIPYDPETAKSLLHGKKIALTLVAGFPNASVHGALPEIIQSQLKPIGVEVNIVKIEDRGLYHDRMKERKGDLWLEKGNVNSADLTFLLHLLFHPDGFYPKQLHTAEGSKPFVQYIELARQSRRQEDFLNCTALALKEVISGEILFIPIAEIPYLLATFTNIKAPRLYPTLLTTRWRDFEKHP